MDEAVALEAKRWEQRLRGAGQETDELRTELQHTLTRQAEQATKTGVNLDKPCLFYLALRAAGVCKRDGVDMQPYVLPEMPKQESALAGSKGYQLL